MKKFTSAAVVAAALAFTGCDMLAEDKAEAAMEQSATTDVPVAFNYKVTDPIALEANTASISVFSGDLLIAEAELTVTDTSITGAVNSLPVGEYNFVVEVLDADGNLIYLGEKAGEIVANKKADIVIHLKEVELTGDANIIGKIDDGSTIGDTLVLGSRETVKDAYIIGAKVGSSSGFGALHYGNRGWMRVGEYDDASRFRGLVQIPVTELAGKEIAKAELVMNNAFWVRKHNDIPTTVQVYPMLTAWNEGYGAQSNSESTHNGEVNTADINGVTALEAAHGVAWSDYLVGTNGIDAAEEPVTTLTYGFENGESLQWNFDITALVKEWVANPESNYGVLLKMADENRETYDKKSIPSFITWDNIDEQYAGMGPRLVVTLAK